MSPQPTRHPIRSPYYGGVKATTRDATKIVHALWRSLRHDDSEVDRLRRKLAGFETTPYVQGIPQRSEPEGTGKIVPTAGGDNQHRKLEAHQV